MNATVVRILGLLIAAAGLVVLLSMPALVESTGNAIMARHGGSMDTNLYMSELQITGAAYWFLGGVALAVGLLRATTPTRTG